MAKSLYICYFGVREPLVQTQVIPYLRELAKGGHELSLLTFEPSPFEKGRSETEIREELQTQGIDWYWLRYHKRFSALATAYDIFRGTIFVRGLIRQKQLDILHGRVHMPTLIGALARKFSRRKPKVLFDIRGFFPEEYTDAGIWPENGLLYRTAKRVERWLLEDSNGFVVLTEKARDILFPGSKESGVDKLGRPVEVIPCCVDFQRFEIVDPETRAETRAKLIANGRPIMVYVGSFGGWYLSDEMMDFTRAARIIDPRIFFLVLTQRDQEKVRKELLARGFSSEDFKVEGVLPKYMGQYLSACDVAISFIKPCYSKLASSPTKLAEYLACGLPVVANSGVGDVDELISGKQVGVVFDDFNDQNYQDVFKLILKMSGKNGILEHCRQVAIENFDLAAVGGARYRRLYKNILGDERDGG